MSAHALKEKLGFSQHYKNTNLISAKSVQSEHKYYTLYLQFTGQQHSFSKGIVK